LPEHEKEEEMNTLKPRRLKRIHCLLLGLLLAGAAWPCRLQTTVTAQRPRRWPAFNLAFSVRNYGGKCLDFGSAPHASGAPVFINDCNGSAAQLVTPVEIDPSPTSRHAVVLNAGADKVIGVKGNALIQQAPLELQDYDGSAGQIFEFDGDSLILAADRQLVVEVLHARGANYTPLVLGARDLADAEFWDFKASDGSNLRPTRGFVRISQVDDFDNGGEVRARQAFLEAIGNAHAGTVIELDANVSIDLTDQAPLQIPAGVTIRGDRRGTRPGPELRTDHLLANTGGLILINANDAPDVRITGIRLRGPSRSADKDGIACKLLNDCTKRGIWVVDDASNNSVIIDHNELSDWPNAAVLVQGGPGLSSCMGNQPPRPETVRIARNFIHHNQKQDAGYGVSTRFGGVALIEGNTFVSNRHAVTGEDGRPGTGFSAWFNLVLAAAPKQQAPVPDGGLTDWYTQDFDMHGTESGLFTDHRGGIGGQYVEIARNTFLGANRENFDQRGVPCYLAEFHDNVSCQSRSDAIHYYQIAVVTDPPWLRVEDNQFNAPNPTNRLGVGDFDGDGAQDLFLATGTAWYYAPAGKAEWRYLNAQTDKIDTLLFGDFDADGRTDVFTQHDNSRWDVSWGGASPWEAINGSGPLLGNAAIGDFDGDGRADVFYADGREWLVSFGGTGFFTHYALAAHRVPDLRFGDFNNDDKTDVFGVVGDQWMVVYGGTQFWAPLRAKLTNSVAGLTVADFNGDGRADVGASSRLITGSHIWRVSWGGVSNWATLRAAGPPLSSAPAIGRFDGAPGADVLTWAPGGSAISGILGFNAFDIASGGAGAFQRHSRQDMR
jgi:hypothetical protein